MIQSTGISAVNDDHPIFSEEPVIPSDPIEASVDDGVLLQLKVRQAPGLGCDPGKAKQIPVKGDEMTSLGPVIGKPDPALMSDDSLMSRKCE